VDHAQHTCLALWQLLLVFCDSLLAMLRLASCYPPALLARWDPLPLTEWTNWVCRWRNKARCSCRLLQLQARPLTCTNLQVGMPCIYDQEISALECEALTHAILAAKHILGFQDCIYGMRRCLSGACMPFQPCLVTVTVSCFPTQHGFKMCAANLRGRLHDLQMADRIDGSNMDER
jgi:hypothetical protein